MGGATRQWVWQLPPTKGEEGDPGPVFLSSQPSSRRQPSRLVPRWGSLQHYTRQALMTSILFPYWAQDHLPPRDSRKKAWKHQQRDTATIYSQIWKLLCPHRLKIPLPQWETLGYRVAPARRSCHSKYWTGKCSPSTLGKRDLPKMRSRDFLYPCSGTRSLSQGKYLLPPHTSGNTSRKQWESQKKWEKLNQINTTGNLKIISPLEIQMTK